MSASAAEIDQLIVALDADKFLTRETATRELAGLGSKALEPVANHFFDATTESAWRVKRVLTEIGTQSVDEETSLKAIGILLVLDNQLDSKLESLIETWRVNRSNRAVNYLRSKGATTAVDSRPPVFVPQQVIQLSQGNSQQNPLRRTGTNRLNPAKAKSQIQELISGDLDSVQKFVFKRLPEVGYANSNAGDAGQLIERQILRAMGGRNFENEFNLEFGDRWQGHSNDLERISEIHNLHSIRLVGQTLSRQDLKTIAKLKTLRSISVTRTKVSQGHLFDIELPTTVVAVELVDQDIENETLRWLSGCRLNELTLENCRMPKAMDSDFSKLSDLETLSLKKVKIDSRFFNQLSKLRSLRRIIVSLCKFDVDDYRKFSAGRSQMILFNPVSFLGVQGTRTVGLGGEFTCEIEHVVQGSAAEKAGIEPGDVIESVNGDKVRTFTDLRMFISQHDIGEEMNFSVRRNGQKLDLTAKLGENQNRPIR